MPTTSSMHAQDPQPAVSPAGTSAMGGCAAQQDPDWGRGGGSRPPGQQPEGSDGGQRPGKPGSDSGAGSPPDLDELWRDFNRRLNALFGRRQGGGLPPRRGGGAPFRTPPRLSPGALLLVGGLLVAGWLGSGFFVVQEGQQAVVTQFGQVIDIAQPGLHWRPAYPIGSDTVVDVDGLRTQQIGNDAVSSASGAPNTSMLTADGSIVDLRVSVQWRVGSVTDYLYGDRNPDDAVSQATRAALRRVVAGMTLDQALYGDRGTLARKLKDQVQATLSQYGSGIAVADVSVLDVQVPQAVRGSFDDTVKAAQDSQRLRNEARAYAQDLVPRARGTAAALIQQAEGYKASVVAQAEGDAARFEQVLPEYRKAPAVTRETMYLQTMQQILGSVSKVLVSSHGANNLLYLPLDKLLQQSSAAPAPAAAASPPAGASAALPTAPMPGAVAPASATGTASNPGAGTASTPTAGDSGRDSRDSLRRRDSR